MVAPPVVGLLLSSEELDCSFHLYDMLEAHCETGLAADLRGALHTVGSIRGRGPCGLDRDSVNCRCQVGVKVGHDEEASAAEGVDRTSIDQPISSVTAPPSLPGNSVRSWKTTASRFAQLRRCRRT